MKANKNFIHRDSSFWAYVKLISEQLGYSNKKAMRFYSEEDIINKLNILKINIHPYILKDVIEYLNYRAELLNQAKDNFMNVTEARETFSKAKNLYDRHNFTCTLPFNKQKNEKKDYAYFTCIINILTEGVIRKFAKDNDLEYGTDIYFNEDPRTLTYFKNSNDELEGILSRRFDGAFPSTLNPIAIWEIKEYYYTTTFGSRIADGVYETQLDGFELQNISNETGRNTYHYYLIDDYNTWWNMGKSYLCRIIDMMHIGLVDEVLFGKEVIQRWPELVNEMLTNNKFFKNKS